MKQIEVVAAIIHDKEGRIFATQRGYGDYKDGWEFPGGKMEPGESPEQALRREIWEELETEIIVEWLVKTVEWDYPQFHLTMHCYWCHVKSGGCRAIKGMAIEVTYRWTRRLSMRIVKNGDVHVSAPIGMPKKLVQAFIDEHREWIEKARKKTLERGTKRADFFAQLPLDTKAQKAEARQRLEALLRVRRRSPINV